MEIRQIRYFLAVQETGSFTGAAEKLFVTQPALSAAIKSLEEELGAQLLRRGHKKVTLTPEGLRFRDRAFAIIAECNAAKSELSSESAQRMLRMGVLNTLNTKPINQLIYHFTTTYPDIELHLETGTKDILAHKLGQGKVDVLLTSLSGEEASETIMPIYQERFQLLLSRQHPLANRSSVRLADLHKLPFVLRKNCEVLNEGKRVFLAEQAQPHITCRTDDDAWTLMMVRNNLAAAIMAETVLQDGLVSIPIIDFGLVRNVGCLWRMHSDHETVRCFTQFAAQSLAQLDLQAS
ncbi:LysR family transcriptional regulator [Neptunomonas marina]|uniref:LysR family transcriptional regulator n=1 Tax=Neptunomonas marina TaxID=1815562 RepID=A0A437Q629_9GAMM|nr:LysR family transcriptional regulator [Neptunomonas marina]RVU29916.1 LysR family transcriptional regulator [Neptunomonas marina]